MALLNSDREGWMYSSTTSRSTSQLWLDRQNRSRNVGSAVRPLPKHRSSRRCVFHLLPRESRADSE